MVVCDPLETCTNYRSLAGLVSSLGVSNTSGRRFCYTAFDEKSYSLNDIFLQFSKIEDSEENKTERSICLSRIYRLSMLKTPSESLYGKTCNVCFGLFHPSIDKTKLLYQGLQSLEMIEKNGESEELLYFDLLSVDSNHLVDANQLIINYLGSWKVQAITYKGKIAAAAKRELNLKDTSLLTLHHTLAKNLEIWRNEGLESIISTHKKRNSEFRAFCFDREFLLPSLNRMLFERTGIKECLNEIIYEMVGGENSFKNLPAFRPIDSLDGLRFKCGVEDEKKIHNNKILLFRTFLRERPMLILLEKSKLAETTECVFCMITFSIKMGSLINDQFIRQDECHFDENWEPKIRSFQMVSLERLESLRQTFTLALFDDVLK